MRSITHYVFERFSGNYALEMTRVLFIVFFAFIAFVMNIAHFWKESASSNYFNIFFIKNSNSPLFSAFSITLPTVNEICTAGVWFYIGISIALWRRNPPPHDNDGKSPEEVEAIKQQKRIDLLIETIKEKGLLLAEDVPISTLLDSQNLEVAEKVVEKTTTLASLISTGLTIGTILGPFFIFSAIWFLKSTDPVGFMAVVKEIRAQWNDQGEWDPIIRAKVVAFIGAFVSILGDYFLRGIYSAPAPAPAERGGEGGEIRTEKGKDDQPSSDIVSTDSLDSSAEKDRNRNDQGSSNANDLADKNK
jgi:hypothetical protein